MAKTKLEKVKRMIEQLSSEDRRTLTQYLTDFPDSGFQTYDLSTGQKITKPNEISAFGCAVLVA